MTGKYALNLGIRFVLLGNMTRCTKRVASGLDGLCLITVQILTPPPPSPQYFVELPKLLVTRG